MTRYTVPSYCDPLKTERGYIHYQSPLDKRCNCIIVGLVAFSLGVGVATAIQLIAGV